MKGGHVIDIVINQDTIVSAFDSTANEIIQKSMYEKCWTIDWAFSDIQTGIDNSYFRLTVSYDEIHHFPTKIYQDIRESVADDEGTFTYRSIVDLSK